MLKSYFLDILDFFLVTRKKAICNMSESNSIRYLIAGKIEREFIVTANHQTHLDIIGGNALYASTGLSIWDNGIGIISRIGEDFPQEWLDQLSEIGLDKSGIKIVPENLDLRKFIAYDEPDIPSGENPISRFAKLGLQIPKSLLGYRPSPPALDNRAIMGSQSVHINDIPSIYFDALAAHICPSDFINHTVLPSILRQGHISTITLDPGAGYMDPVFWEDIPAIANHLTAFITSEKKIRSLFQGRTIDLWEMAEAICSFGCEIAIINQNTKGVLVYDNASKNKWIIPAYPAQIVDPTGREDAFCGGFLSGFQTTYDPLQAALYGSISYSFSVEGSGPFYPLGALPGLAKARVESLKSMIHKN